MSLSTAEIEHTLSVIRREFAEEFNTLTVIFIAHDEQNRLDALKLKESEIKNHPAGAELYDHLLRHLKEFPPHSCFAGMARRIVNLKFRFSKKERHIAVIFISKEDLFLEENKYLALRQLAYFHSWEALTLWEQSKKKPSAIEGVTTISRPLIGSEWLRKQMLADCFAAMILEKSGERNIISQSIRRRCEKCLSPIAGYRPEDFPFPLALDATMLVYRDLHDAAPPKTGLIAHTKFMVNEIGDIYDDITLNQWVSFAHNVQEMAWTGHNNIEILSAAVFSCDDPHTRSTAYILAEALEIDPAPLKDNNFYNPFAEQETNERAHFRIAREKFTYALERSCEEENNIYLYQAAEHSNTQIIEGGPTGWCAQALFAAYNAFSGASGELETKAKAAKKAFEEELENIPWKEVLLLHRVLIKARRHGIKVNRDNIQKILQGNKILSSKITAFAPHDVSEEKSRLH